MDADELMQLVVDCENRESRLNGWERGFVDSIRRRLEQGQSLTDRQRETLESVWEHATERG